MSRVQNEAMPAADQGPPTTELRVSVVSTIAEFYKSHVHHTRGNGNHE